MSKFKLFAYIVLISSLTSLGCHHHGVRSYDYKPVDYEKWASGIYNEEFIGQAVIVEGYINKRPAGGITPYQGAFGMFKSPRISLFVSQYSYDDIRQTSMRNGGSAHQESTEMISRMVQVSAPISMRDRIHVLKNRQKVKVYGVVKQIGSGIGPWSRIYRRVRSATIPIFVEADRIELAQK
ncbi:MAG: hypothetical protein ABW139_18445 [Candidatus Thiodiazotropha sp. DIVDIV]